MTDSSAQKSQVAIELEVSALESLGDLLDHDVVAWDELVQTQLTNGARLASDIRDALAVSDWATLERAAHTLKSSSALFGARDLASRCQVVETAANRRELAELHKHTHELLERFEQTERALRHLLGRVP